VAIKMIRDDNGWERSNGILNKNNSEISWIPISALTERSGEASEPTDTENADKIKSMQLAGMR
jgi:hypothetical protein